MKKLKRFNWHTPLLFLTLLLTLNACKNDDTTTSNDVCSVKIQGRCLMVNMGNYSESNGSICAMQTGQPVQQNLFYQANGYKLRSIIESAAFHDNLILLMCGNEDKVTILNADTYKEVCSPITGIGLPRYACFCDNYAYVTCVNPTWKDTVGFVTKINLKDYTVQGKTQVKGNPEDIINVNGRIFIASGKNLFELNPQTDSIVRQIPLPDSTHTATARYMRIDHQGRLLLSYAHYDEWGNGSNCGIAVFDLNQNRFVKQIGLSKMNADAYIDLSPDKQTLYYLYAENVVGGQNPEAKTSIYTIDLTTDIPADQSLCDGYGFYGLNVDTNTGNIYTANVNGFITNSMLCIYSPDGQLLQDNLMTGVGTCRFYFR